MCYTIPIPLAHGGRSPLYLKKSLNSKTGRTYLTNIWLKNVYDIYNDNGVQYALVSDLSPTNLYVDADRFAAAGLVLPP
jgi:hypothetical protein